jgi:hypothetical protein
VRRADARAEKQQRKCDAWNDSNPIGTSVVVRMDSEENRETVTRSVAQVLSGHTAVIWLGGISGCYALGRVEAKKP